LITLIPTPEFSKSVKKLYKKYKQLSSDLKTLEKELLANPKAGVELSNNLFKLRVQNSSIPTGKSGGFRVVYYFLDKNSKIYLIDIYSKTDIENVSETKLIEILKNNGLR